MFPYIIMRALDMLQRGFSTKNCRKRERWEAAPHWHLQPEVFCWEVLPQVGLLLEAAPMPFRGVLPIFCRSSMQIQAVLELRRLSVNSFEVTCRVSVLPLTQGRRGLVLLTYLSYVTDVTTEISWINESYMHILHNKTCEESVKASDLSSPKLGSATLTADSCPKFHLESVLEAI